jgi:nucleoside-diphosphate-sugar epimerase
MDNFNSFYNVRLKKLNGEELKQCGVKIIKADILNYNEVREIVKNMDVIFHLAAQPGVRYSLEHPLEVFKINVEGTVNLLQAIKEEKRISLFLYASSSSVYGNCTEFPIKETAPTHPISPYGLSKLVGEKYVKFYKEFYNLPTTILRFFTVTGARQRPDMGLYKFISNILYNKPITIFGDGSQTRDWSNVLNVVEACLKALDNPKGIGETFNVGHGKKTSVNKIIEILENAIGKKAEIVYEEKNLADPQDTQADISKITALLNFKPIYSLTEAIESEIEFIKNLSSISKPSD